MTKTPYLDRLMRHVERPDGDGCWQWIGTQGAYGYGQVRAADGRKTTASRAMYEAIWGAIDPVLDIDHICRNRLCVNPSHLEAVSHKENIRRGNEARGVITHCKWGHKKQMLVSGWVRCPDCNRANQRRFRERHKVG